MINELPKIIKIYHPETYAPFEVETAKYVKAKTGDLREYGYQSLTETQVEEQLLNIFNKKDLSVIGMFMVDDICME